MALIIASIVLTILAAIVIFCACVLAGRADDDIERQVAEIRRRNQC